MSENLLKMALMKEMQTVIEYQEIYAELNEGLFKLVRQVAEYYERQGLEIPERQHFNRILNEAQKILEKRAGMKMLIPDGSYHGDDPTRSYQSPALSSSS
jgi:hypothetical protein